MQISSDDDLKGAIRNALKKVKEREIPNFPKEGYFSFDNLSKKSLRTLYRIKKAEKESYGSFSWYMYPSNIKKLLQYLINLKNENTKVKK